MCLNAEDATQRLAALQDELEHESDRAAVVLATAELDEALRRLLLAFFLPPSATSKKYGFTLFGNDEAAGTLSARIELTYRLGLMPPWWQREAHLLRKIRNEFAHQSIGYSFTSSPARELVGQLEIPKKLMNTASKGAFPRNFWKKPKNHFTIAAMIVTTEVVTTHGNVQDGHLDRPKPCGRKVFFGADSEGLE